MIDFGYLNKYIDVLVAKKEKIENLFEELKIDYKIIEENQNIHKFTLDIENLHDLRVACVMDTFTEESYSPECKLMQVTPKDWKNEIDEFKPHLLFIESAWQGKDKLWYRKIANGSKEYFEMTSYCQEKNIPIVFWNKEDPVYTDTFMMAAKMADYVFTTDIDCIKKYKQNLHHDNVFLLHFAAQPKIHNPIEKYNRKNKYCFAGAYYHRYVNRCRVFDDFAKFFINTKGFDIYDRNYKNALPEHAFPKIYDKYILGNLKSTEIDIAYKGYDFGINMNSIDQSQTMFARRVFEMLASNTVTIGNYSRGVKNYFGDLTISTNDAETLKQCIDKWCNDEESMRKYRLLGLRKVLSENLYEDRLSYIVERVFDKNIKRKLPEVTVLSYVENSDEAENVLYAFKNQKYVNKKLILITDMDGLSCPENAEIISTENANGTKLNTDSWVTVFDPQNHYGKNYLMDIMLTNRYADFEGIGKYDYYKNDNDNISIIDRSHTYKSVNELKTDRSVFKTTLFLNFTLQKIINTKSIKNENFFCVDEFNFCEGLNGDNCDKADDVYIADDGIGISKLNNIAENIKNDGLINSGNILNYLDIFNSIKEISNSDVIVEKKINKTVIKSSMDIDKVFYINIEKLFNVNDFIDDKHINLKFEGQGSLDILGTCIFYNKNREKISPLFTKPNRLYEAKIPDGAEFFKLCYRIRGNGTFDINNISIGSEMVLKGKACFISRSNVLILTNQYPSQEALYRNMFVHKRLMAYKAEGLLCDVMRMNIYAKSEYREFEGINIVEGHGEELANILETGNIDTVCVHFLDRQMWEVLKGFKDKVRIIVWVHGAEIQPWWRRKYNYSTEEELEKAKVLSEERMKFWAEVFNNIDKYNIHFVFVSQYFADEIFKDNKITISKKNYSIIHNCIDTNMFNYVKKDIEQRKKLLSIRPYASNKYANDLTVKAILELSKRKCFSDMQFTLIGNGELFDETLKPLKKYKNINIKKTFLRQSEISRLHKENGIFITPTRMDAQGVSRDEAMSSGLVPVTNAVTAIPEFVDENCGVLAPGEDFMAMADGIERLYDEPEYFLRLSENAAKRVRSQTSKEYTIDREIKLIKYKIKE
ncbi:MAG: glycosyltransferase [Clostridia bacterium]|nr:glycosyltransferase [Clostridia bacterium]MCI2000576.1 glycosyltransferase [Clostridia bacterium]MCI2015032.1 glycosyltransferase [Clostridia bacterium]